MTEEVNRQSQITDTLLTQRNTLVQSAEDINNAPPVEQPKAKIRINSIDIYRGLTMVGMILVDNMGPVDNPPWWLDHPAWHGLTPADFIFPAFLFIMGMAVPLAISRKRPVNPKNLIRIAGLFLIGFMLNLIARKFNFDTVRVPGILQRLSICYGAILLYHRVTSYGQDAKRKFGGIIMFGVFIVYLSLMISFNGGDIEGCSRDNNLTDPCNIVGYIDRKVLTKNHMLKRVYTDPQGIFSTIGAIITTYMGYQYSIIMSKYKQNPKKLVTVWLSIAILLGAITYPMYLATPFNKKLYTPSFILVMGAVTGAGLTFFYFLVDILPALKPGSKRIIQIVTAPFLWLGLNPLAIFVLMDLLGIFFILYIHIDGLNLWSQFYNHVFASWISNEPVGAVAFAFFFVVLWTIVAGIMHKFKFYVRL